MGESPRFIWVLEANRNLQILEEKSLGTDPKATTGPRRGEIVAPAYGEYSTKVCWLDTVHALTWYGPGIQGRAPRAVGTNDVTWTIQERGFNMARQPRWRGRTRKENKTAR